MISVVVEFGTDDFRHPRISRMSQVRHDDQRKAEEAREDFDRSATPTAMSAVSPATGRSSTHTSQLRI